MNKIAKVLKISSSILMTLVVILAFLLVGMRVLGFQIYTILSPSMAPKYPTGAIIYVKKVDTADLKAGDVITYQFTPTMTATHRIIEVVPDEQNPGGVCYRTKGDNRPEPDNGTVSPDRVLGKVVFGIPLLGFLANFVQSPPGIYVAIAFAGVLMLMTLVADMLGADKKKTETNEDNPS